MAFTVHLLRDAEAEFLAIKSAALNAQASRAKAGKSKSSPQEGLYKQIVKCLARLADNPRHPGLHTHEFASFENPFCAGQPAYEAYVQNKTPGAYRIFWCYGPERNEISVIAITPHA